MIEMVDSAAAVGAHDLYVLEVAVNASVPERYRAFLLEHNGGRPKRDTVDIVDWPWQTTDVSVFYGVNGRDESCDILWNLEHLEGCKENQLLPIASDSGGNQFVIVVANENYGQIYYFDACEIPPRPYFVAKDFDEFLSKLREPTPEELADD